MAWGVCIPASRKYGLVGIEHVYMFVYMSVWIALYATTSVYGCRATSANESDISFVFGVALFW